MVDPAGMWPGAGSGPDGRRLATQARLALTALLPVSAAFPMATPAGVGSAPAPVVTEVGGAAVPHAVMNNPSTKKAAQRTLSPYLVTAEAIEQKRTLVQVYRTRDGRRTFLSGGRNRCQKGVRQMVARRQRIREAAVGVPAIRWLVLRRARRASRLAAAVLCSGLILGGMAACGASGREGGQERAPGVPPGCLAGKVELSYRLDGPRPGSVCVRAGTELVITLEETRGYAWTAVESSHPAVVRVLRSGLGPKVTARARAVSPGDAELRWTSSFTGDPHGPPTLLWRLVVTVAS